MTFILENEFISKFHGLVADIERYTRIEWNIDLNRSNSQSILFFRLQSLPLPLLFSSFVDPENEKEENTTKIKFAPFLFYKSTLIVFDFDTACDLETTK